MCDINNLQFLHLKNKELEKKNKKDPKATE